MSRSYKKTPVCVCACPYGSKRLANKRVRRHKLEDLSGARYKRIYCSWDIKEYVSHKTLGQAIAEAKANGVTDVETYINTKYNKWYRRK